MVLPVVVVTFPQDGQPEFHVLQVEEHAQAVAVSFVQAADMPDKVVARLIQLFGVAVPLFQQQQVGVHIEYVHKMLFLSVRRCKNNSRMRRSRSAFRRKWRHSPK